MTGGCGVYFIRKGGSLLKKDKLITDPQVIESIIRKAKVMRLAMVEGDHPYLIPLNFGYESGILYFHTGLKGRKIDVIRKNPHVCFEMDVDHEMVESEIACKWTMKFCSVVGHGQAVFIESNSEKRIGLDAIMRQYSDQSYTYPDEKLKITSIIKIEIESMTALVFGQGS